MLIVVFVDQDCNHLGIPIVFVNDDCCLCCVLSLIWMIVYLLASVSSFFAVVSQVFASLALLLLSLPGCIVFPFLVIN